VDGVLAFDRGLAASPGTVVRCVANLSGLDVGLPPGASVLLASGGLNEGRVPTDTTVWLRIG